MIKIDLNNFSIANNLPFVLIAGPCVIENEEHTLMMAEQISNICSELKIDFIFNVMAGVFILLSVFYIFHLIF